MFAPFLLTLVLASASADDPPDAVTLIGRLGSESFDDRVAAYKALERLGGAALPALRAAADTSDMRVRSRVLALIESIGRQIEADRFARPTMIRLDFRTRPLGEVVDALNDRYDLGLSLRLGPEPRRGMRMFDPGRTRSAEGAEGPPDQARGGPAVAVLGGDRPALRGRRPSLWHRPPARVRDRSRLRRPDGRPDRPRPGLRLRSVSRPDHLGSSRLRARFRHRSRPARRGRSRRAPAT